MENEILRLENVKIKNVIIELNQKPAPLLKSYSLEIKFRDIKIEKLVSEMSKILQNQGNQEELKNVLENFHNLVNERQILLDKDSFQLVNPKVQEKLVRLENISTLKINQTMEQWLKEVSEYVSPEQIKKIYQLKIKHYNIKENLWKERAQLNSQIKEFYQDKVASERMETTIKVQQPIHFTLKSKLTQLKNNIIKEEELNQDSLKEFSSILNPYQEAMITIKSYSNYKENLSAIGILTDVWSAFSNEEVN